MRSGAELNGDNLRISTAYLRISDHCDLSMTDQVSAICRAAYCQLRQLLTVTQCLTLDVTKTTVQAFISCRLDYCNALLYGIADDLLRRLQSVQKQASSGRDRPLCQQRYLSNMF